MRFENMQEFLVLTEYSSYSEAAERLYISQGTLSRHIKDMEAELGAPLFTRSTRKVELTEFGVLLLPYAKQAVELKKQYETAFAERIEKMNNTIIVGSIVSEMNLNITDLLTEFQTLYPSIRITLINDETDRLIELLTENCCDFAFVRERSNKNDERFCRLPFFKDCLTAYLPTDHPLAGEKKLSLSQLKNERFVMCEETSLSYLLGVQACKDAGFEPDILFKGNRFQTLNYINKGLAIGLMFEGASLYNFESSIAEIQIDPPIYAYVNLDYRNVKLNQPKTDFLKFMVSFCG